MLGYRLWQLLRRAPPPTLYDCHPAQAQGMATRTRNRHQAGSECRGVHHGQPGAYCPLGGIFVRLGIAKVDQRAIAQYCAA